MTSFASQAGIQCLGALQRLASVPVRNDMQIGQAKTESGERDEPIKESSSSLVW